MLASEPRAHVALVELLEDANGELAERIVDDLVFSPFSGLTRNTESTARIRAITESLLTGAADPRVRSAAALVLFRYAEQDKGAVRQGLRQLSMEADPGVRDTLLTELSLAARKTGLTREELRPLTDRLREEVRSGRYEHAEALSYLAGGAEDFRLVQEEFRRQRESGPRQALLNAYARDSRLVEGRVAEARRFLVGVMLDGSMDANTRGPAFHLLKRYTPWEERTAAAVSRDRAESAAR